MDSSASAPPGRWPVPYCWSGVDHSLRSSGTLRNAGLSSTREVPNDFSAIWSPSFAGRLGVGFSYEIPRTRFSLFSQGTGWVYNFDNRLFQERESRIGVDGRQFDIAWTGGISYRLRLPF